MLNKTLGFALVVGILLTGCDAQQVSVEQDPPTITSVSPEDGDDNVPIDTRITVVFSEQIPPSTVRQDRFEVVFAENDSLERGSYEVEGNTARFIPQDSLLDSNAQYRVTVDSVADLEGNKMEGQKIWTFSTEDIPPTIASVFPAEGATGVALDTTISVQFSEEIEAAGSPDDVFNVVFAANDSVENGSVSISGSVATFTPADDSLDNNADYRVTVDNVQDMGGNALQQPKTWEFATTDTTSSN